jgi:hypothetical protein
MNVTLRRSLMVCVLALILAATAAGTASAAPRTVDPDTLTPPPPPDAECKQTGGDVICHGSFDDARANQPDSLLSCGRAYSTGSEHGEYTLRYSDGLLVKIFFKGTDAGTWSLSPTGEGPTIRFASHRNSVTLFAVPGDFDSATEIEHGLDFRMWRPGSGVMLRLAGIFVFAPDDSVTHHGAGELAIDEEGNLIIPPKADAALCEALQP